jgi:hypothetical protein
VYDELKTPLGFHPIIVVCGLKDAMASKLEEVFAKDHRCMNDGVVHSNALFYVPKAN